jgi:hypothetical protein
MIRSRNTSKCSSRTPLRRRTGLTAARPAALHYGIHGMQRTGRWPKVNSGPVADAPGERWDLIGSALRQGQRGHPGGSSLLRLLVKKRGVRDPLNLPPLSGQQIMQWAR